MIAGMVRKAQNEAQEYLSVEKAMSANENVSFKRVLRRKRAWKPQHGMPLAHTQTMVLGQSRKSNASLKVKENNEISWASRFLNACIWFMV